jgi:threonine/homoserine/homoserine lactone efflux protein
MIIVASGATHGIRKTIPFVSGATIGFILLLLALGIGFLKFIAVYPAFLKYMAIGGASFILYMSYKLATSTPDLSPQNAQQPKFSDGFFMQWLNPKAWLACISGLSFFVDDTSIFPLFLFATLYFLICFISLSSWAVLGDRLNAIIGTKLKVFNYGMALLLSSCAIYLLYSSLRGTFRP